MENNLATENETQVVLLAQKALSLFSAKDRAVILADHRNDLIYAILETSGVAESNPLRKQWADELAAVFGAFHVYECSPHKH